MYLLSKFYLLFAYNLYLFPEHSKSVLKKSACICMSNHTHVQALGTHKHTFHKDISCLISISNNMLMVVF